MIRMKIVLVCDHSVISCQLLQSPKLSFFEDYTLLSFFLRLFSFPCNLEYIIEQGRDDLLQVLTSCSGALSSFVVDGFLYFSHGYGSRVYVHILHFLGY